MIVYIDNIIFKQSFAHAPASLHAHQFRALLLSLQRAYLWLGNFLRLSFSFLFLVLGLFGLRWQNLLVLKSAVGAVDICAIYAVSEAAGVSSCEQYLRAISILRQLFLCECYCALGRACFHCV